MAYQAGTLISHAGPSSDEARTEDTVRRLQVFAYLEPTNERLIEDLAQFQIQLTVATQTNCTVLHNLPSVVLIDEASFLKESRGSALIAQLGKLGCAIVLLLDQSCDSYLVYIESGTDGIAYLDRPMAELSAALWIAHRQYRIRREFSSRLSALEAKIEYMKLIGQAKAVVAEQLNITEAAALRHLRAEARKRRRPLHQLASVVLEARRILGQTVTDNDENSS